MVLWLEKGGRTPCQDARGRLGVGGDPRVRMDWSLGTPVPSPPYPSLMFTTKNLGAGWGQTVSIPVQCPPPASHSGP